MLAIAPLFHCSDIYESVGCKDRGQRRTLVVFLRKENALLPDRLPLRGLKLWSRTPDALDSYRAAKCGHQSLSLQRTVPRCLRCALPQESKVMDTTTLLIIVVIVLLLGGGGFYGRGRWW
jgi:hypothetical protein